MGYNKTRAQQLHDERAAKGICVRCGKQPTANGRKACAECARKIRALNRETYKFNKDMGLCLHCGKEKAKAGFHICTVCSERLKAMYREKKMAGPAVCIQCGKPNSNGYSTCDACLRDVSVKSKARRERYKAEGRCIQCGKPNDTNWSRCNACLEKSRVARKKSAWRLTDGKD